MNIQKIMSLLVRASKDSEEVGSIIFRVIRRKTDLFAIFCWSTATTRRTVHSWRS